MVLSRTCESSSSVKYIYWRTMEAAGMASGHSWYWGDRIREALQVTLIHLQERNDRILESHTDYDAPNGLADVNQGS